ncbi:MAG: hypothetical protein DGJ47_000543 [Rickettsiaceae bacterium]
MLVVNNKNISDYGNYKIWLEKEVNLGIKEANSGDVISKEELARKIAARRESFIKNHS